MVEAAAVEAVEADAGAAAEAGGTALHPGLTPLAPHEVRASVRGSVRGSGRARVTVRVRVRVRVPIPIPIPTPSSIPIPIPIPIQVRESFTKFGSEAPPALTGDMQPTGTGDMQPTEAVGAADATGAFASEAFVSAVRVRGKRCERVRGIRGAGG